jgi:hypothetical protein
MKKTYLYYLLLFTIPVLTFSLLSLSGGRDGQYSGSPGDGFANCTTCHSGGSFGAVATISSNIPATGFVYGDTYQITVSVASSSTKHGFQLTAEDLSQTKRGIYIAGTGNQIVNGGTHMTHTNAGNSQSAWVFDWIAPDTAEGGTITFYAAVNATNANSSTSGDEVVTTSKEYLHSSLATTKYEAISLSIFPNPTSDYIILNYGNNIKKNASITITNYMGQIISQVNTQSNRIDVSDLSTGAYMISIESENKRAFGRFLKK